MGQEEYGKGLTSIQLGNGLDMEFCEYFYKDAIGEIKQADTSCVSVCRFVFLFSSMSFLRFPRIDVIFLQFAIELLHQDDLKGKLPSCKDNRFCKIVYIIIHNLSHSSRSHILILKVSTAIMKR